MGVEVEKTGGGSHDLEVSEQFVAGGGGSSAFGDKDRSGEAVDQEVALGLSVGVPGNEGIDGVHGADIESVVHGNETVSYTHLDVYKRQIIEKLIFLLFFIHFIINFIPKRQDNFNYFLI